MFFCNSGAEATEAAVKIARRAAHEKGDPERMTILCATGAFHGRTLGMLAATDRPVFRTVEAATAAAMGAVARAEAAKGAAARAAAGGAASMLNGAAT